MQYQKRQHRCIGCGHRGDIYDFSPSIQIGEKDFRIFHPYGKRLGPLYCVECKKRHLIEIADQKGLTQEQIDFLKKSLRKK